jgi:hypothetical protein
MNVFMAKLILRVLIFGVAFFFAMKYVPKQRMRITKKWAWPLVIGAFAGMNFALYWVLSLILSIPATVAGFFTFGAAMLLVPVFCNGVLLYLTNRWIKWFKIEGALAYIYASGIVTAAHLFIGITRL